jgi:hypothetical protein
MQELGAVRQQHDTGAFSFPALHNSRMSVSFLSMHDALSYLRQAAVLDIASMPGGLLAAAAAADDAGGQRCAKFH